jgi:hypothetical protein
MPLFDALVLIIGCALVTGYFVHKKSYRDGVTDGTDATLAILENEGLIMVDDEGTVHPPPAPQRPRRTRKSKT